MLYRYVFIFIMLSNVFSFITNSYTVPNKIISRLPIKMTYDPLKGYDEKLTIIPSFQATIIINNWIRYLSDYESDAIPEFMHKSIYDTKIFISINKIEKNTVIFAWCPGIYFTKTNVVYIISCKRVNNELQIHRIAQSPYYSEILDINSYALLSDIKNIVKISPNISSINYDELHLYDNRYLLSWNLYEQ